MDFAKNFRNARFTRTSIIVWALYIAYEVSITYFLAPKSPPVLDYINAYSVNILIFYVNAHFVLPRVYKKPLYIRILCVALELVGYIILKYSLTEAFLHLGLSQVDPFQNTHVFLLQAVWRFILFIGLSTGYWFALNIILQRKEISDLEKNKLLDELRNQQLEKKLIDSEIAYLKSQINPHFLFNTLNFLYNSAQQSAEHLARPIMLLSDIMRYAITETPKSGLVSLNDEIEQIYSFIELNQLRFDQRLQLSFKVTGNSDDLKILPLILLTPIENVFKYADLKDADYPAEINLEIKENHLYFVVKNKKLKRKGAVISNSIGIKNLKLRLDAYYADQHHLEITYNEDNYKFELQITL